MSSFIKRYVSWIQNNLFHKKVLPTNTISQHLIKLIVTSLGRAAFNCSAVQPLFVTQLPHFLWSLGFIIVTVWEKCAVRLGRLQGECSTDWAIRVPDTLSPQWWLSSNYDIHPHRFEIPPRNGISEGNFHRMASSQINQAYMNGPHWAPNVIVWEKMCSQTGTWTRDTLLTGWVLYGLSYPAAWHINQDPYNGDYWSGIINPKLF